MTKFINTDATFCDLILAVQREDKNAYIDALETLEMAFATKNTLPAPLPADEPVLLFTQLRNLLWHLARTASAELPAQTRLNEMCEILRDGGYLAVQYELVAPRPL